MDPNSPPSGRAVREGTAPDLRRPSHNGGKHPPGDAPPPPPQRATPARKGARCGAGAGSPRPHRPHPGHTGCGTLAARFRGRAAGGGTAPDLRRPSQRWQAAPSGTAPNHPRGTQPPQGAQAKGTVLGPHTNTPAPTARGWWTQTARPVGGQSGEGQRLTSDAPHTMVESTPLGTPFRHPHSEQRRPARAHAMGQVLGLHARTDRTWDRRVAGPRPPAPEDGRPGEGQRLTPDVPHTMVEGTPLGKPFRHPHSEQRRPARAHAMGPVLGLHTRTDRTRDRRVAGPRPPAPEDGQPGEGQRLTQDAPHNGGRHPPRGRPSATPTASNAGPQGRTLWARCWVSTPAPTAPGTHGLWNPGCPLQRTGGRGRDTA